MRAVAALGCSLLVGCGARSGLGVEAQVEDASATADGSEPIEAPPPVTRCDALIAALSAESAGYLSTLVVRIAPADGSILGYQSVSENHGGSPDEATLLKQLTSDTGFPMACFHGDLEPSTPGVSEELAWMQPASAAACACCGDGWVVSSNVHITRTTFAAAISFGPGEGIVFPKTWRPASDLVADCPDGGGTLVLSGWDLTQRDRASITPPPLPKSEISFVETALGRTVLSAMIYPVNVWAGLVFRYARDVTKPDEFEYVVVYEWVAAF